MMDAKRFEIVLRRESKTVFIESGRQAAPVVPIAVGYVHGMLKRTRSVGSAPMVSDLMCLSC